MFSVLLSIYYKESIEYFDKCMKSIWDDQTLKPNEIVLVIDGSLPKGLDDKIIFWKEKLKDILNIIRLEKNLGTGGAKKVGVSNCIYNYIAIMDTDDISMPERFQNQVDFLDKNNEIDVVGTYIAEINEKDKILKELVKFPLTHNEMLCFFKKRDPIAHPTAMFRKRYFENAGNYSSDLHLAEDTLLWYHGFLNNCKFANIDYVGLHYRRTKDFYMRRANKKKIIQLFKFRINTINRELNYDYKADFFAFSYLLISVSPSIIKQIVYRILR